MSGAVVPVFIPHAGCPNLCVFCNQRAIAGACGFPTAEEIERIVFEAAQKTGGVCPELAFYGGSFTSIPRQMQKDCLDAAARLFRRGLISSVRFSARPDAIDDEILDFVLQYPVETIELGVQSMEDKVLELAARGCTSQDATRASELVKSRGIALILQMMVGLPGEDSGSALRTAGEIAALEPDGVRIYPVVVIRGTELEGMMKRGEYTPLGIEAAADICGDLLGFFESRGIRVIRCGLNPSEELEGEVIGGAYHPAFGEIARSRLLLKRAAENIRALGGSPGNIRITVAKTLISAMLGQRRENVGRLKDMFELDRVEVKSGEIPYGKVEISAF